MDTNNWRPAQGEPPPQQPTAMDAGEWRSTLQRDSRQRIVNKIMNTLKGHLPFSGQEGLNELEKIAVRFEEKIYNAATSQSDYLRKLSLKMLTMETKSQGSIANSLPLNPSGNNKSPPDTGMDAENVSASSSQQHGIDIALQAAIPILQNRRPRNGRQLQLMYDTIETMASAIGWRPEPQEASASGSRSRKR